MRTATINRTTNETSIKLTLNLDGSGVAQISTGVGFLDHMLTLFTRHALIDLTIAAQGDRHVDDHHTVEDVGICLGQALVQAVGNKAGMTRYGSMTLPMDETLATAALDLSGRPFLVWKVAIPVEKIGTFDTQLGEEFWRAFSSHGLLNFHAILHHGTNGHHILEAVFKAAGRALRQAITIDPREGAAIPSTKGSL